MAANKGNAKDRKKAILKYLQIAGAFILPTTMIREYAKKWEVSERQIYLDVKNIIKKIPKPEVKIASNKFLISFDRAITEAINLIGSSDPAIKSKGINDYLKCVEGFTKFMESYGFKEKVAEKREVKIESLFTKEERQAEIDRLLQ